ncbi:conserved hypothetical protein [Candidatus Nitrospira nitrificans]|uniref:Uncharacterized protein n=1 Tax=Candidatus Nitrospira nitrificans TaxID=1742973 RepID=A0A0S4LLW9_9BACT|nr:conserved hypothetical protein [Candidatus Nitrospira nitrificans]
MTPRLKDTGRSPARTNVTLTILRVADLAAALLEGLFEHPVNCCDNLIALCSVDLCRRDFPPAGPSSC